MINYATSLLLGAYKSSPFGAKLTAQSVNLVISHRATEYYNMTSYLQQGTSNKFDRRK